VVQRVTLVDSSQQLQIDVGRNQFIYGGRNNLAWQINGVQYLIPYVRHDDSLGISTAIRIENVTGAERHYWLLVKDPGTGRWTFVSQRQPISAGSVLTLLARDIMKNSSISLPNTGFPVRIVIDERNSPQNVPVYATQYIGGGYRHIPALKSFGWTD